MVVDALYGTGFHGALRPSGLAACGLINHLRKSGAFVLAVDLPSGINTDTGETAEGTVHADLTVLTATSPCMWQRLLHRCAEKSSAPTSASGMNGTQRFEDVSRCR